MAKQLYDYWFVQFDFPDEKGRPYKSSGGKMVWNDKLKREIPEGWDVVSLNDVAKVKKGDTITFNKTTPGNIKVVAGGVDFAYYNGVSNRPENTITVSASGNAGYLNFWREPIFASDCTTVNFDDNLDVIICWYGIKLFQEYLYSLVEGSMQPHIYPSQVGALPILKIPSAIKEQVRDFFIASNKQIARNERVVEDLVKLRDELLPLLMNGQASVNYDL